MTLNTPKVASRRARRRQDAADLGVHPVVGEGASRICSSNGWTPTRASSGKRSCMKLSESATDHGDLGLLLTTGTSLAPSESYDRDRTDRKAKRRSAPLDPEGRCSDCRAPRPPLRCHPQARTKLVFNSEGRSDNAPDLQRGTDPGHRPNQRSTCLKSCAAISLTTATGRVSLRSSPVETTRPSTIGVPRVSNQSRPTTVYLTSRALVVVGAGVESLKERSQH